MKGDRVREYFRPVLDEYVFDRFTDGFLERLAVKDIMSEIPVPINSKDFADFKDGGIRTIEIVRAVSVVLGCDPSFKYKDNYAQFLDRVFRGRADEVLINEGYSVMAAGDALRGAAYFRAALSKNARSLEALYGYALACRALYTAGGEEDFVGRFKAEAIEAFELLSELYPDFAFSYYYLGYAYLNMGLYTKAQLTWRQFIKALDADPEAAVASEERKEIEERLASLKEPVEIERGINAVASGRYIEGIQTLEPYKDGEYKEWWPMHYYLGIAYECAGMTEEAIAAFKRVLSVYPSHIDSMDELVAIYHMLGEDENEKKYFTKIQLVKADPQQG